MEYISANTICRHRWIIYTFTETDSTLTCNMIVMVDKRKYLGKSFACNFPNVCRGRFLNMVIPSTNVVYAIVPNQVPKERRWMVAAACADNAELSGDCPARAMERTIAEHRNQLVLWIRCSVQEEETSEAFNEVDDRSFIRFGGGERTTVFFPIFFVGDGEMLWKALLVETRQTTREIKALNRMFFSDRVC